MSSEIPSSVLHGSTTEPFYVIDWKSANLKCRLFAENQPENEALESSVQNVIYDLKCDGLVSGAGPMVNGNQKDSLRRRIVREWVDEQGRLHHPGGKAARETDDGQLEFWEHGVRHRAGGLPAVEIPKYGIEYWESGVHKRSVMTNGTQMWFNESGDLHRDDGGPAIVYADGRREWWRDGIKYREDPIEDVAASMLDASGKKDEEPPKVAKEEEEEEKNVNEESHGHHHHPHHHHHHHRQQSQRQHRHSRRTAPKSKQQTAKNDEMLPPPPERPAPVAPEEDKESTPPGPPSLPCSNYFSVLPVAPQNHENSVKPEELAELEAQIEKTIDDLSVMLDQHRREEKREQLERTRTEILGRDCVHRAKSVLPLRPDLHVESVPPDEKLTDSQCRRLIESRAEIKEKPDGGGGGGEIEKTKTPEKKKRRRFGCLSCGSSSARPPPSLKKMRSGNEARLPPPPDMTV